MCLRIHSIWTSKYISLIHYNIIISRDFGVIEYLMPDLHNK